MSQRERDRLKVMSLVMKKERTQMEAGRLLRLSPRQVRRIQRRLEAQGDVGVVHRLRGRPSNSRIDLGHHQKVIAAYRQELMGFGPTFASEKLAERKLPVAARTLRQWLVAEGIWERHRKRDQHRQRRERRECLGELVQADGSHHDWLEGRGPWMVLVVMIDDATSKTMAQANKVIEQFLQWFNRRCAVKAASPNNAHRPLHPSMKLPSILSIQDKRHVTNDYTIRLNNEIYQLLPPALPGLRGGRVTVQRWLDGSLHLQFKGHYLKFKTLGPAKTSGALPPNPRSLSPIQTPAELKEEGLAAKATRPSAVRLAIGRSGRTPAEPCPPKGKSTVTQAKTHRPPPDHPWRRSYKKTGYSNLPQTPDISICA